MGDFDAKLRPHLEGLLSEGERIEGICAASQQRGLFKGGAVALGVTDRRLLVQPLSRRGDPEGEALSLSPSELASAKADGAGGGWAEIGAAIMDHYAVKLTLQTTAGEKLKLMMMRADGPGPMASLGGGESQRSGVEALGRWFARISPE